MKRIAYIFYNNGCQQITFDDIKETTTGLAFFFEHKQTCAVSNFNLVIVRDHDKPMGQEEFDKLTKKFK